MNSEQNFELCSQYCLNKDINLIIEMLFLKHLPRNHYYFIKGLESECAWFKEEYDTVRKSMNYVADTLMEMIAFAGLQLESIV